MHVLHSFCMHLIGRWLYIYLKNAYYKKINYFIGEYLVIDGEIMSVL